MNFLEPKNEKCCSTCGNKLDCPIPKCDFKKIFKNKRYKKMYSEIKETDTCHCWEVLYDEETT